MSPKNNLSSGDILTTEVESCDEKTDLWCPTTVAEAISSASVEVLKVCSDCNTSFALQHFHKKNEQRYERRCIDCHNMWRRSRYQKKPRLSDEPKIEVEFAHQRLNENSEGFQLLLDLVCDDLLKGLML